VQLLLSLPAHAILLARSESRRIGQRGADLLNAENAVGHISWRFALIRFLHLAARFLEREVANTSNMCV
jgi:hypothetical protein